MSAPTMAPRLALTPEHCNATMAAPEFQAGGLRNPANAGTDRLVSTGRGADDEAGANVAIFSFVDGLLLKPLAYPEADRIVHLGEAAARTAQRRLRAEISSTGAIRPREGPRHFWFRFVARVARQLTFLVYLSR